MAVHVVKNPPRPLGNVIASSLGNTLSQLAQAKVQRMKTDQDIKLLTSLGIDPLHARFINTMPPEQKIQAVGLYLKDAQQQNEQQPQEEQSPVQQALSPQQAPQMQQQPPFQANLNQMLSRSGIAPELFPQDFRNALQQSQQPQPDQQVEPQQNMQPESNFEPVPAQPPAPAPEGPHARLGRALSAPKGKAADQELKERKQTFTEQRSLAPFLEGERKEYAVNRQIARKAQEALDILRQHHKEWPGAFKGSLSPEAQRLLIRNPKVREYASKINELVILKGQSRRGLPSNFKLKLEQAAKADLSQPIQTQEAILESMVDDARDSEKKWSFINSQKSKDGNYPLDLPQRAVEFDMAMDDPISHPELFKDGTVIEEGGKQYTLKNGKWQ